MIKVIGMKNIQQPYSKKKKENIWCAETLHGGLEHQKIGTLVLGNLLVRSLVRSHHSLIHLLRTPRSRVHRKEVYVYELDR